MTLTQAKSALTTEAARLRSEADAIDTVLAELARLESLPAGGDGPALFYVWIANAREYAARNVSIASDLPVIPDLERAGFANRLDAETLVQRYAQRYGHPAYVTADRSGTDTSPPVAA